MKQYNKLTSSIIDELKNIVGEKNVIVDEEKLIPYEKDEAEDPYFYHLPDAVVLPSNAKEISAIMKLANKENIPVVPRGAGTGLAFGAVASYGGIVVDISKMNKIIEDYKKIVAGNEAGKNICFMSRGEYADPEIAYNGILMNYWDVYDCMDEVEEPTDDDWLNAVSNLFDSYTYDVKNTDVDKFKMSDVMNVYRIINL